MTQSVVSVDLMHAARRSESFPKDWSEERTQRAIVQYGRFLQLAARYPGVPLAPTLDIDTIWHLHMLSPRAYYEDCTRLFGTVLDHDGGFGHEPAELPVLQATFADTARRWQEAYGEPYVAAGLEATSDGSVKCTRNCQSRCWHACKTAQPAAIQ